MDFDTTNESVHDQVGDMFNECFDSWCKANGIKDHEDGSYEKFQASDVYDGFLSALETFVSDHR
jgi:hypothetical protein